MERVGRIRENGHPGDAWEHLLEQLDLLSREFGASERKSCDVPTGVREAGDEPVPHGIAKARPDDRNRVSGLLGRTGVLVGGHDDDVNPEAYQIARKGWKPLVVSLARSLFDREVSTLDVPECPESLDERLPEIPALVARDVSQD